MHAYKISNLYEMFDGLFTIYVNSGGHGEINEEQTTIGFDD